MQKGGKFSSYFNNFSQNKHYNNMEIEQIALDIGAKMIENGAEINRVEDTITRILSSRRIKKASVFCISSIIIISTQNKVYAKRIRRNDLNLFGIEQLNSESRCICEGKPFQKEENTYPLIIKILSVFLATGSFCIYFGGNIRDALFAGITGLAISCIKPIINAGFAKTFCDSVIAGILAYIPSFFISNIHPDKIMIGTIMLSIPGLTVGNAMRDIMNSDTLSGIIELINAVFTALSIALGFSAAVLIFE